MNTTSWTTRTALPLMVKDDRLASGLQLFHKLGRAMFEIRQRMDYYRDAGPYLRIFSDRLKNRRI
jgi:O-acetylhomoserine/O-acetylserine sulfhydrylase-like pyridoxal-dependent enzyme